MESTRVTFPSGALTGSGSVVLVGEDAESAVVVVDVTPFHPVDHTWPDQPGDAGAIRLGDHVVPVTEAVMVAVRDDGMFAVGAEIPVKRGAEGWTWLVGHRVPADALAAGAVASEARGSEALGQDALGQDALGQDAFATDVRSRFAVGAAVELSVDASRRAALSRGHTACHLASLALDAAVADLWRKDPGADALGNPDFEGRANQSSRIHPDGSVDEYRLGKSLRRAGFDTETFAATLAERESRINSQLAAWVASGAPSRVVADGLTIVDRRRWECDLPQGTASIPCGGTHVSSLAAFERISVSLELADPQLLVMTTTAVPAGSV